MLHQGRKGTGSKSLREEVGSILEVESSYRTSRPATSDQLPPMRLYFIQNSATSCLNVGAHGDHFTFKSHWACTLAGHFIIVQNITLYLCSVSVRRIGTYWGEFGLGQISNPKATNSRQCSPWNMCIVTVWEQNSEATTWSDITVSSKRLPDDLLKFNEAKQCGLIYTHFQLLTIFLPHLPKYSDTGIYHHVWIFYHFILLLHFNIDASCICMCVCVCVCMWGIVGQLAGINSFLPKCVS